MLVYMLLNLFTFGKVEDTRWGAWLVGSNVLSVFDWIESQDLEGKVCYIETDDGRFHYWTDTEPCHVSFWKRDGDWRGGFYENDGNELLSLLSTAIRCSYIDRKQKELLDSLQEKAEPWWNVVEYSSEIPPWAQVIERWKFQSHVEDGIVTDDDGFGLLVKDGKMSTDYKVMPSYEDDEIAQDATHIAWISETYTDHDA